MRSGHRVQLASRAELTLRYADPCGSQDVIEERERPRERPMRTLIEVFDFVEVSLTTDISPLASAMAAEGFRSGPGISLQAASMWNLCHVRVIDWLLLMITEDRI